MSPQVKAFREIIRSVAPTGRFFEGHFPRHFVLGLEFGHFQDGFRAEAKVLARNLVDATGVHAGKPQLDLSKASAVECILSRRDSMIVARHEVPGDSVP
jgi:hypothetical protein